MARKKFNELTSVEKYKRLRNNGFAFLAAKWVSILTPYIVIGIANFDEYFTEYNGVKMSLGCTLAAIVAGIAIANETKENKKINGIVGWAIAFALCFLLQSILNDLLSTTLADYCYYQMFRNCYRLTNPPQLPALILADYCYYQMFQKCSSLVNAPQLPATTLATYCYYGMFAECSALITFSATLSAKTLPDSCYAYMFGLCTNLHATPTILAETLYGNAITGMFGEDVLGTTTTYANDIYLYSMKELKLNGTTTPKLDAMSKNVHFGTALVNIEGQILSISTPSLYFHFTNNDTVSFNLTGKFAEGTSKNTKTYNVYTDNTTIKNSALNNGAQYVTVNVYHLDGSAW